MLENTYRKKIFLRERVWACVHTQLRQGEGAEGEGEGES